MCNYKLIIEFRVPLYFIFPLDASSEIKIQCHNDKLYHDKAFYIQIDHKE